MRGGVPAVRRLSIRLSFAYSASGPSKVVVDGKRDYGLVTLQITLPAGYLGSSFMGAALIACVSLNCAYWCIMNSSGWNESAGL